MTIGTWTYLLLLMQWFGTLISMLTCIMCSSILLHSFVVYLGFGCITEDEHQLRDLFLEYTIWFYPLL